ncbi:hypothetical protein NEMIN01_1768 [Nematocida minor]|uniref:uncharacterized protein n=1 Tax=Nematocida minor TaxID=1912983 RepID=UPI002220EF86|nr:uncharacterized protein NEMIN01_1768 [Nematocida minor]KAI5191984.1 hypothetical protein NEMIN01_1768 [Nematocida minor]
MRVDILGERDKSEDSLLSIVYTGSTKGIYSLSINSNPLPKVEVEPAEDLSALQSDLETVLTEIIKPHDRFSYKLQINLLQKEASTIELFTDAITAISILISKLQIEAKDTPVAYTKEYPNGTMCICKGYFRNTVIFAKINGALSETDVAHAMEHIPSTRIEELVSLLSK